MRAKHLLLPLILAGVAAPARAETVWATLDGWRVTQFDDSCMVGSDQGLGRTPSALRVTLMVGKDNPGLIIDNARWNIKADEALEVDLTFDGGRSFITVQGIGTAHGMAMLPRPLVISQLRMAEGMTLIHKGRILEHFKLTGSDAAFASGLKCIEAVKMKAAAGQK